MRELPCVQHLVGNNTPPAPPFLLMQNLRASVQCDNIKSVLLGLKG